MLTLILGGKGRLGVKINWTKMGLVMEQHSNTFWKSGAIFNTRQMTTTGKNINYTRPKPVNIHNESTDYSLKTCPSRPYKV